MAAFENSWTPFQACFAARPVNTRLATCERTGEAVSSLASSFANGVVHGGAERVAEAFLEVLDVFLVGGGDLVDLVWWRLA